MKVDIIASYYNQWAYSPFFEWGIKQNADHIGKVFVVSDGPFRKQDYVQSVLPEAVLLEHDKFPHGVGPSLNQGIAASTADYVFTMSYDQILTPGLLERMFSHAGAHKLVIGSVDSISDETLLDDLPHPTVTRRDTITQRASFFNDTLRSWVYARNGCTLINRETFNALGGFDQRYAEIGYGLEDLDYGARLCTKYSLKSIILSQARTWHFSSNEPTPEERKAKTPKPEAFELLTQALATLYQAKYELFAEKLYATDAVLVSHTHQVCSGGDVRLDCEYPEWIPDKSALRIATHLPNEHLQDVPKHLIFLLDKLSLGGSVRILGTPDYEMLTNLSKAFGVYIDIEKDYVELSYD